MRRTLRLLRRLQRLPHTSSPTREAQPPHPQAALLTDVRALLLAPGMPPATLLRWAPCPLPSHPTRLPRVGSITTWC
jgi:hypothetical protein